MSRGSFSPPSVRHGVRAYGGQQAVRRAQGGIGYQRNRARRSRAAPRGPGRARRGSRRGSSGALPGGNRGPRAESSATATARPLTGSARELPVSRRARSLASRPARDTVRPHNLAPGAAAQAAEHQAHRGVAEGEGHGQHPQGDGDVECAGDRGCRR